MTRHELGIRTWLGELGTRCSGTTNAEVVESRARDYAQGLIDLPPAVFCPAAREAASRQFDRFPAYALLRNFLDQWWAANKPVPPALPGADDPTLDADDRGWLKNWERHKANGFRPFNGDHALTPKAHLEQARQYKPRVYAYLVRTDTQAAEVAVLNGWAERDAPQPRTAADIAHAEGVAREARAHLAAVAEAKRARRPIANVPENIEQAREEVDRAYAVIAAATAKATPAHLPPAMLDAVRDANPIIAETRAAQEAQRAAQEAEPDPPAERGPASKRERVLAGAWIGGPGDEEPPC
jgi:hypothetical protein